MDRKGFAPIIIVLVVAAALIVGGIWYGKTHKAPVSPPISTQPQPSQNYPDQPLAAAPDQPISVMFLFQHRTALNGKVVVLKGFVVGTSPGVNPAPGMGIASVPPSITLADSMDPGRDKYYDVPVYLSATALSGYQVGQQVQITATANSFSGKIFLFETPPNNCAPSSACYQSEQAKESRDSQRAADLATLKSAISIYLADVANPVICSDANRVYRSNEGTDAIDGMGWLPVNFTEISSGAPIRKLPVDPINSGKFVYLYVCNPATLTFKLATGIESEKYGIGGPSDMVTTDGGNQPALFEVGTGLNLKISN